MEKKIFSKKKIKRKTETKTKKQNSCNEEANHFKKLVLKKLKDDIFLLCWSLFLFLFVAISLIRVNCVVFESLIFATLYGSIQIYNVYITNSESEMYACTIQKISTGIHRPTQTTENEERKNQQIPIYSIGIGLN